MQIIGWADLGIDLYEGDSGDDLDQLASTIDDAAAELDLSRAVEVSGIGGEHILRITLVQNRDNGDGDRCLELLRRVGQAGPASYGVFYKRDDETSGSLERFVLRRGSVEVVEDDLFSLIIPVIEDP